MHPTARVIRHPSSGTRRRRYFSLMLPDAEVRRAVEIHVPPYPVSEPVFVRVRLEKLTPATDLRACARRVTRPPRR